MANRTMTGGAGGHWGAAVGHYRRDQASGQENQGQKETNCAFHGITPTTGSSGHVAGVLVQKSGGQLLLIYENFDFFVVRLPSSPAAVLRRAKPLADHAKVFTLFLSLQSRGWFYRLVGWRGTVIAAEARWRRTLSFVAVAVLDRSGYLYRLRIRLLPTRRRQHRRPR